MTDRPTESPQALRRCAEKKFSENVVATSVTLSPDEMGRRLHELEVHQIELEMQNEELCRTQAELDASRDSYLDLYDLAPVAYLTLSEQGQIQNANLTAATLFGIVRGKLLKQPLSRFIFKEDMDRYNSQRKQLIETHVAVSGGKGEPQKCELRMVKNDGTVFWVVMSASVPPNPVVALTYRIVINDITEWKQADDALRESQQIIEGIINAIPVRVFWKDKNLVYLGCNEAFARDAGFADPKDIIGKDDYQMGWRDQAELYRRDDLQAIKSGVSKLFTEEPQTSPEGKSITLLTSKLPLRNSQGDINGVLGTYIDITERKQAEEEKLSLQVQLQQSQKIEAVGRLAGGVAHDFNNMLGVIIGYTEMALMETAPGQAMHDNLTEIRKAAERSADLTRQLLAFARKQTITPKELNLNKTVAKMLRLLQRLIGENIKFNWQPGPQLWPIYADASQIDQILANLCVNVRDAIADVGIMTIETGNCVLDGIWCAKHMGSVPGEYVRITLSDNGCGMEKDVLDQIFDPFFTTKEVGKGTGLGLATVFGAVKQNNGFITVSSKTGARNDVRHLFPATSVHERDVTDQRRGRSGHARPGNHPAGGGRTGHLGTNHENTQNAGLHRVGSKHPRGGHLPSPGACRRDPSAHDRRGHARDERPGPG
jgi:PAS domain S-box-containing protein